jgi:Lon protease-like protein
MYNRSGALQGGLGATPFMEYGTMLEIINLELLGDGRSFVETRGVGRFRIQEHGMLDGYVVSRVEKVEDISLAAEQDREQNETTEAQQLAAEFHHNHPATPLPYNLALNQLSTQAMLDFCMQFVADMRRASAPWLSRKIVEVYGEPPADPAIFPYWFACVLPISEEEKYHLLHATRVRERLKIVKMWIEKIQNRQ